MISDLPPAIPPDAALAVAGRVDPATHAALEEARRIRDGWRAALERSHAAARVEAAAELAERWRAAQVRLHRDALELATSLAQRLGVEDAKTRLPALLQAVTPDATLAGLSVWVAEADADRAQAALPPGLDVRSDPALAAGEIRVEDPHGWLDARLRAAVRALVLSP